MNASASLVSVHLAAEGKDEIVCGHATGPIQSRRVQHFITRQMFYAVVYLPASHHWNLGLVFAG
jgi:hypothetical protein